MGLAFLITSDNLQILSERKVLKEHEYAALLDANSIVSTAKQEAERILEAANLRKEALCEQGYQEGFARGEREGAQRAFAATLDTAHALAFARNTMADLVVRALHELIGSFDRERIFARALDKIDALVREEAFLIVRVAPDAVESMREVLAAHRDAHAGDGETVLRTQAVRVVPDPTLGASDCVVETPAGSIDARLGTQIDAIRAAILDRRAP
ncbi:HrpE/YscL family type III secretion apparatus protein [Trinickia dabaoshanensis]|uniref:Type 3 secretion system stator protein n=1 Tax=Trinickia dabaoshanensis TaxID=564714 RepID=A0A2N7VLX5_9BURK|nr:type III secretion system stator protein SctL [Trinickia dabaoshanensis]PMS18164.1 HrpE/YscL family type III secretion apparatus protein [Trinickia dabaoshanensis]